MLRQQDPLDNKFAVRTKEMMPKDATLDMKGLRLHYLDWGKNGKQPMLLLHGFMAHAHARR